VLHGWARTPFPIVFRRSRVLKAGSGTCTRLFQDSPVHPPSPAGGSRKDYVEVSPSFMDSLPPRFFRKLFITEAPGFAPAARSFQRRSDSRSLAFRDRLSRLLLSFEIPNLEAPFTLFRSSFLPFAPRFLHWTGVRSVLSFPTTTTCSPGFFASPPPPPFLLVKSPFSPAYTVSPPLVPGRRRTQSKGNLDRADLASGIARSPRCSVPDRASLSYPSRCH